MGKALSTRNFVIAGHAGSGKTTLCEKLLLKGGAIQRCGTIEAGNTVSDFMPDEQERRGSIYGSAMHTSWNGNDYFFMDTPGYGEFVGEVFAALRQTDAALVVVDGVDGPQVGTARAWKNAKKRGIARFGFISRLDRERASFRATLAQMRKNHGKNVAIPLFWPVGEEANFSRVVNVIFDKDIPPEIADDVAECKSLWMDAIAETDDELMSRYLDGEELTDEELRQGLARCIRAGKVIAVCAGSVAKDIGISELMDTITKLFPTPLDYITVDGHELHVSEEGAPLGIVFKAINDPTVGQLTLVRTISGVFRSDSDVFNVSRGGAKERFGTISLINGKQLTPVKEAGPGTIFAVAKLKDTHIGDTVAGTSDTPALPGLSLPKPVMSYAITAAKRGEDEKIATALRRIIECDPSIELSRNDETHETLLSGMGDQQLGIVAKRLKDQFKVDAVLATPSVPYRETITAPGEGHYRHKKQTGGAGQFAEVYLKIAPNEAGFEFANEVVGGTIPKNFIPAVEKGVNEMMAKGPLVGCPVEKVRVAVYDGKYHPVDSNEMAFKIASSMAFREAMKAAKPVLLEPIMQVTIMIPDACMGDITGDLNHKRGRVLGVTVDDGLQVIQAEVPLAEMHKYATEIRSITGGRGSFSMEFLRYEPVPPNIANEIIAKHAAEAEAEA